MRQIQLILYNTFKIKLDSFGSRMLRLTLLTVSLFVLHIMAMVYFEGMKLGDAVWITFTTATTVGYGDLSASTPAGRASTILLMYLVGLWVFAEVIGLFMERREFVSESKKTGDWRWDMKDHIVIINTPDINGELYLSRLINEFRADNDFADTKIVVMTEKFPEGLSIELRGNDVVLVSGTVADTKAIENAGLANAKYAVVVCDKSDESKSDSYTLNAVYKTRKLNPDVFIAAECAIDENREGIFDVGANAIVRPVRSYPGLIVRAIDSVGSEKIFEDLFSSAHAKIDSIDDIMYLHTYMHSKNIGTNIPKAVMSWKNIVLQTIQGFDNVPVGLRMKNSEVFFNPDMSDMFELDGISGVFILSNEP